MTPLAQIERSRKIEEQLKLGIGRANKVVDALFTHDYTESNISEEVRQALNGSSVIHKNPSGLESLLKDEKSSFYELKDKKDLVAIYATQNKIHIYVSQKNKRHKTNYAFLTLALQFDNEENKKIVLNYILQTYQNLGGLIPINFSYNNGSQSRGMFGNTF